MVFVPILADDMSHKLLGHLRLRMTIKGSALLIFVVSPVVLLFGSIGKQRF